MFTIKIMTPDGYIAYETDSYELVLHDVRDATGPACLKFRRAGLLEIVDVYEGYIENAAGKTIDAIRPPVRDNGHSAEPQVAA